MNRKQRQAGEKKSTPSPAAGLLAAAQAHHRAGQLDQAIDAYREVLAVAPESVDAMMNLANVLTTRGRRDEAVQLFRGAARRLPRSAEVHLDFGAALLEFGLWDEALVVLQAPSRSRPARRCPSPGSARGSSRWAAARRRGPRCRRRSPAIRWRRAPTTSSTAPRTTIAISARPSTPSPGRCSTIPRSRSPGSCWRSRSTRPGTPGRRPRSSTTPTRTARCRRAPRRAGGTSSAARTPATRLFATTREGLLHGLGRAPAEGLVVELGVRYGISTRWLAAEPGTTVHGFDSFEGLPEEWHVQPKGVYSTHGAAPPLPVNVTLHVGLFADTLPPFLAAHPGPLRFLHVDCDLYSSTRDALEHLGPRVVPGTVITFDEYLVNDAWREDEFKAFQEAVAARGWRYEYLAFNLCTGQAVVRVL